MSRGKRVTDEEFVAHLSALHTQWQADTRFGRPAGKPFTTRYLYDHGPRTATLRLRRRGQFAALLARAPEVVQRDWLEPSSWKPARIERVLRELFVLWQKDTKAKRAGTPWNKAYVRRNPEGRRLLKMLDYTGLRVEVFIHRIGGDLATRWKEKNPWRTRAIARAELLRALAAWEHDERFGLPAGKSFSPGYLVGHGYKGLYQSVRTRFSGGMSALVRSIPKVAMVWQVRRPLRNQEIAEALLALYRRWWNDTNGRLRKTPFGREYLIRTHNLRLYYYIRARGIDQILRDKRYARVRADWARRVLTAELT